MSINKKSVHEAQWLHYSGAKVRSALVHFFIGKFASALLSFITLLILLRMLPIQEYGVYVTLMAMQGMVFMFSSLGLDASIDRFIPEMRLTHSEAQLRHAVILALSARLLVLLFTVGILWLLSFLLLQWFNLSQWKYLFPLFLLVVLGGGLYNLSSNILDAFLLQKWSQIAGFTHVLARLVVVIVAAWFSELHIETVIYAEIVSYAMALVIVLLVLARYFSRALHQEHGISGLDKNLVSRIINFAGLNYGAQILMQAQGAYGLRLLVSSLLGITAAAKFGFVMSLADILQRYLPTTLLVRLIRPVFVSRYTSNRDFSQLNGFATLLFKINLIFVAPAIALSIFYGGHIVFLMGGVKYVGTQWLLVLALSLLLTSSHTLVISLIANTLEKNILQFKGGVFSLIGLAIGVVLSGFLDMYGLFIGALVAAIAYNTYAIHFLRSQGFHYAPDLKSAGKILFSSLFGMGLPAMLILMNKSLLITVCASLLGIMAYWFFLRLAKPLSQDDKALLTQVLPKKLNLAMKLL